MMLIPRVHPYFLPLLRWNSLVRWIVLLGIVLVISTFFYFGVQSFFNALVMKEQLHSCQLLKQVRQANMAESESLALETSNAQLQQLIDAKSGIDQSQNHWNIVSDLLHMTHANGLQVKSYMHRKDDQKIKNHFSNKLISLDYSGSQKGINQFFVQLRESKKMLQIKRIQMNAIESDQGQNYSVSTDIALVGIGNEKSLQLKQAEGLGG